MPVPTLISELSQTPASNSPVGSVDVPSSIDDYQRTHAAFIAQLRDNVGFTGAPRAASGANSDITSLTAVASINVVAPLHLNDIINGSFKIAQAGTSFAAAASGAYDLDGWYNSNTSSAVFTVAQVVGNTPGELARQVTITTADSTVAAGDYVSDETRIEGYNIVKYFDKTFTIAFRAKVPVAGIHCIALRNGGFDRSYIKEINFPTANVWQDCSFTVTGGLTTAGTWNVTNGVGLVVSFAHMAGANVQTTANTWNTGSFLATANQVNDCATLSNVWALEKVTMNLGTVAAVSEISYEADLVRAQRYYEIVGGTLGTNSDPGYYFFYKAAKRAIPTVTWSAASGTLTVLIADTTVWNGFSTIARQGINHIASARL